MKSTLYKRACAVLALGLLAFAGLAHAANEGCTATRDGRMVCPPPDGKCLTDRTGEVVCSSSGGGIVTDRYGDPACGPGYCVVDTRGDIFCSSAPRGAASIDRYGAAVCTGSCVAGRPQACVKPQPAR